MLKKKEQSNNESCWDYELALQLIYIFNVYKEKSECKVRGPYSLDTNLFDLSI